MRGDVAPRKCKSQPMDILDIFWKFCTGVRAAAAAFSRLQQRRKCRQTTRETPTSIYLPHCILVDMAIVPAALARSATGAVRASRSQLRQPTHGASGAASTSGRHSSAHRSSRATKRVAAHGGVAVGRRLNGVVTASALGGDSMGGLELDPLGLSKDSSSLPGSFLGGGFAGSQEDGVMIHPVRRCRLNTSA